tara:strand:- start:441 stop:713 length:273 start_codon:yes stop_codon:yes gene_type:complete
MYVKSGSMSMDVKTTEGLETGSSYPDASLDGTVIGFGFHKETDDGFFLRAEWTETEIDGVTLTSSTNTDNTVTLDEVTGEQYRLSVGKAF